MWWLCFLWQSAVIEATSTNTSVCGAILRSPRGTLQTPGFPAPFSVPIRCRWVIENSRQANSSVVVYLTQVYVTSGLTFSELVQLEGRLGRRTILRVTKETATEVKWLRSSWPYLLVDFALERSEGNRLRATGGLFDVHGFNITYAVLSAGQGVADKSCSVVECSFSGHCYAAADYRHFYCSCFKGISTEDCGKGPLCEPGHNKCPKNATCRQFGSSVAYCQHHNAVTIPAPNCSNATNSGDVSRWVIYQIKLKLTNFSSNEPYDLHTSVLEQQIEKCLPNVTKIRITDITSTGDVVCSVLLRRTTELKFSEIVNNLTESCLGKYSYDPTNITIKEEHCLKLLGVHVNHGKTVMRERDEFILSCLVQGSSLMSVKWMKDGILVNASKAIRSIWTEILGPDTRGTYTAVLGVGKASVLDGGTYTCQVTDWGVQKCLSIRLDVLGPPEVTVLPRSLTVEKGGNAQLICMSRDDTKHGRLSYKWTKDKAPISISPGKIMWEDLYPIGTILNIYNAQESASYACLVEDVDERRAGAQSGVLVSTVGRACCLAGQGWPRTAAGASAQLDCPPPRAGVARRPCSPAGRGSTARWRPPTYSGCVHPDLALLRDNLEKLSLGYQNTTVADALIGCLAYLRRGEALYPGEGEPIVSLLSFAHNYSKAARDREDFLRSVGAFYEISNHLLDTRDSVMSDENAVLLQETMATQAALWGAMLRGTENAHVSLSAVVVNVLVSAKAKLLKQEFPLAYNRYPSWMKVKLNITLEASGDDYFDGNNITTVIIAYRNLSAFLLGKDDIKLSDAQDARISLASSVVVVVVVQVLVDGDQWRPGAEEAELAVSLEAAGGGDGDGWRPHCARAPSAGLSASTALDWGSCATTTTSASLDEHNLTTCRCLLPGSYLVVLAGPTIQTGTAPDGQSSSAVVVIGCACCLVQTLFALASLLPCWWRHRSCFVYLKMQCCTATSGAMVLFIYGVRSSPNKSVYPYVAASLEVLLLVGTTSHLAKVLIVYSEVVQLSRSQHINKIVISSVVGSSIFVVLCIHLAHNFLGWTLTSWWLMFNTKLFIMFAMAVVISLAVYAFFYVSVTGKLRLLSRNVVLDTRTVNIRLRFLQRGTIILLFMVIMEASSILYINLNITTCNYIFGCSSTLLGFTISMCYLWKSEIPVCARTTHNLQQTECISEECVTTSTQLKGSVSPEVEPGIFDEQATLNTRSRQEIGLNIQKLIAKTRKKSTGNTTVPLHDVSVSTVETIMSINEDYLDDTIISGLHPSTSTIHCSTVKSMAKK